MRGICSIMRDGVRPIFQTIKVSECSLSHRRIRIHNLNPNAVALLKDLRDGPDLDVETIDLTGFQRFRFEVTMKRTIGRAALRVKLAMRCLQPSACNRIERRRN